jgi:hypothetical protein
MRNQAAKEKPSDSSLLRTIIVGLIIGCGVAFFAFILPRIWPEKSPDDSVVQIQYNVSGSPLLELLKNAEGKTDYDIIASREVEEFKVFGKFQGDNWVDVLLKVLKTYDKQLKYKLDEKNKRINIERLHPTKL